MSKRHPDAPHWSWTRVVGLIVGVAAIALTVALIALYLRRSFPQPVADGQGTVPPLRVSAQQLLLTWQSFPGRAVSAAFCTVRVRGDAMTCTVIDGARPVGQIALDRETLDPASSEWAGRNCSTEEIRRTCSVRISGIVQKGADGRPLIERGTIEP